jgi:hypothetical protein
LELGQLGREQQQQQQQQQKQKQQLQLACNPIMPRQVRCLQHLTSNQVSGTLRRV